MCDFFVPIAVTLFIIFGGSVGEAADGKAKRITLDLKDAAIHNVIRLLADVGRVNIVVPDEVQGRVTVHLENVPWTEALAVILRSKGLGYEKNGSVIEVDTEARSLAERVRRSGPVPTACMAAHRMCAASLARQAAEAAVNRARARSEKLVTRIIPLAYAGASELAPLVRSMLSERGTVSVDVRTNTLIVTDVEIHGTRGLLPAAPF